MQIYPAIDIKDGKCVNLRQGKFDEATIYNDDPVAVAINWSNAGATFIHIVDLDGARYGTEYSNKIVSVIAKTVNIPVQIGGGIRNMDDINKKLSCGVERVILGTAAIDNPDFVRAAQEKYGTRIAIGIDAVNGIAATDGWLNYSDKTVVGLCAQMADIGIENIIYTDILKDGMMSGVNIETTKELIGTFGSKLNIIASGGVSGFSDLDNLQKIGTKGVIIGKAIYNGTLDLSTVIKQYEG